MTIRRLLLLLPLWLFVAGCADLWGFPDLAAADGGSGSGADGGTCVKASPGTCGLAPQCGCAGNQTCDVTDQAGTAACVDAGSNALGHGCNTTGDCAPGLTCLAGACRPYCSNANAQCDLPGTGLCVVQGVTPGGVSVPNDITCIITCQLDNETSCGGLPPSGPVAACIVVGDAVDCRPAGRSITTCGGGSNGTDTPPLCAPGYECDDMSGNEVCVLWCRYGTAGECPAGQNCNEFSTPEVIAGIEWGFCN
jgi:hypothetical protein